MLTCSLCCVYILSYFYQNIFGIYYPDQQMYKTHTHMYVVHLLIYIYIYIYIYVCVCVCVRVCVCVCVVKLLV
jgi:hypothetical protein